jgi:hypothetical protein
MTALRLSQNMQQAVTIIDRQKYKQSTNFRARENLPLYHLLLRK